MNQKENVTVVLIDPRVFIAAKHIADRRKAFQEMDDNVRQAVETLCRFLDSFVHRIEEIIEMFPKLTDVKSGSVNKNDGHETDGEHQAQPGG